MIEYKVRKPMQCKVLRLFHQGKASGEIAEETGYEKEWIQRVINKYGLIEKYTPPNVVTELPRFEPDQNPDPFYDNHDEYSRHWAGAEKEDNRTEEQQGRDWPIQ